LSIPLVSISQVKAARALLGWSQETLAQKSGVSLPTIKRLEAQEGGIGGRQQTATKLIQALEAAGASFIEENGDGPGVRLVKGSEAHQRLTAALRRFE
jgi:predicted transcriptional regulator